MESVAGGEIFFPAALSTGAYADGAPKQDFLSRSPKGAEWFCAHAMKELDLES